MKRIKIAEGFQRVAGLIVLLLVAVAVSPRAGDGQIIFLQWPNITDVLRQVSETGIIALAMTLVIISAGIDLSVGSVLALAASLTAKLLTQWNPGVGAAGHIVLAVGIVLSLTTLLGTASGALIARLRVQPFIVTLAGMIGIRGLARYLTNNANIDLSFGGLGAGAVFARTVSEKAAVIATFLTLAAVFSLVLRRTVFGRYVRALGDNATAALYAGLPVRRIQTTVYALSGLMAGIAGVIHCAQNSQGSPNDGVAYELDAIAAVVIGGTSLAGGRGSIAGTIIGTLIMGVLTNIFRLKGVDINAEMMVKAGIIVAAVWLQQAGAVKTVFSSWRQKGKGLALLVVLALVAFAGYTVFRPKQDPLRHVIFSQCNNAEPYRAAQNERMAQLFAERGGGRVSLEIMDAQQDNSRQISQIETAILKKPDLLIVAPNESGPLTAIMGRAMAAGIPVICLERNILETNYTTYIKCDNAAIGRMAGELIVKKLTEKNGEPKGKVVELRGMLGISAEMERCNGARDVWKRYPGITVVQEAVANWLQSQARDRMTEILRAQPEIDVVYGHNDPMAVGAYLAARALGREKDMVFVGIDGLGGEAGGIRQVLDGVLAATFVYPLGVDKAVEVGLQLMRDKTFVPEKEYVIPSQRITPENAREEYEARTLKR